jgi:hypothetical protein
MTETEIDLRNGAERLAKKQEVLIKMVKRMDEFIADTMERIARLETTNEATNAHS